MDAPGRRKRPYRDASTFEVLPDVEQSDAERPGADQGEVEQSDAERPGADQGEVEQSDDDRRDDDRRDARAPESS